MNIRMAGILLIALLIVGCSGSSQDSELAGRVAAYEEFARRAYDALSWEDVDALVEMCALPGDVDLTGQSLAEELHPDYNTTLRKNYEKTIEAFIVTLNEHGGTPDMSLVRVGKPIGLMGSESEFVGNMFLIVNLGGQEHAIEVGSSQQSANRGRVIIDNRPFALKSVSYYQELASIF